MPSLVMKRSLPSEQDDECSSKRQRTITVKKHHLKHKQPGALLPIANPQDPAVIDSQLDRALSIALYGAGFNAVKRDAFESLRGITHEFMTHFTRRIQQSMLHARRSRPLPGDLAYAISAFNIPLSTLQGDLDLHLPPEVTQPPLFPRAPSTSSAIDFDSTAADLVSATFGSTVTQKQRNRHVPKHFPTFPPPHTYKATPVMTEREADARRVRERATQEGVLAEQALRKLVAARRPGRRSNGARLGISLDRAAIVEARNEEAFREAMKSVMKEDRDANRDQGEGGNRMTDGLDDERMMDAQDLNLDFGGGALVNYDRAFWRKGAAGSL